ncbi:hypothetical protein FKN01_01720 [Streptomyces sp. 130]|uniref:hypothetical protein n=1 Tax=Streptomyces sp. 130 TaxID=2591006 RepID=UPI0011815376|nr:hypothetical protein [Streptomyces sp. 130]TRV82023.1 hypothetical protein FKN01_01720 [Streptomyces sp. 130]
MTKNAKIGAALVGGYLLGRTKKAKLAVGFGMFLLGKKFDLDPRRIGRMLAESPALGPLNDQVRKELVDATRTAATKAVTQRAGSLAESLQRRTQSLSAGPGAEDDEPYDDAEDADDAEDPRASDDDGDEDTADRDERPKRGGSARKSAAPAKKAASKSRPASGGSRSASAGKAGKAAAPARKRAGGAAKTATSRTRKTRGGSNA